jgi:hypothetical protein
MTLDLYGHLYGDELDAVADRIDAARAIALESPRPVRGLRVVGNNERQTPHHL